MARMRVSMRIRMIVLAVVIVIVMVFVVRHRSGRSLKNCNAPL